MDGVDQDGSISSCCYSEDGDRHSIEDTSHSQASIGASGHEVIGSEHIQSCVAEGVIPACVKVEDVRDGVSSNSRESMGSNLEGGTNSRFSFSSESSNDSNLGREMIDWKPSKQEGVRLDFLIKTFQAYTHSLQTLHLMCQEVGSVLVKKAQELEEREKRVVELEHCGRLHHDFQSWQQRLCEQEAQLLAQQTAFNESAVLRVQECLRQLAEWEQHTLENFRSLLLRF